MREGNALRAPGDRIARLTSRSSARERLPQCHWPGHSSGGKVESKAARTSFARALREPLTPWSGSRDTVLSLHFGNCITKMHDMILRR